MKYKVFGATSPSALSQVVNAAAKNGWRAVSMVHDGDTYYVLMQRTSPQTPERRNREIKQETV